MVGANLAGPRRSARRGSRRETVRADGIDLGKVAPGKRWKAVTPSAGLLAGLMALAILWHLLLPPIDARYGSGVYVQGPIPAVIGAGIGLTLHRAAPPWLR